MILGEVARGYKFLGASKNSWMLIGFATALAVWGFCPGTVFGCRPCLVADIDPWVGSTQSDAESYNTVDFWKCPGQAFGWYVEWDMSPDNCSGVEGLICLIGGPTVDTFTAGWLEWHKSGTTGALPSSLPGGTYEVRCWMCADDWNYDDAAAKIKVVEVELECVGHPAGFTLLPDKKLCSNAQPEYGKTKWKAKKVRPSGTTATVTASGPVSLTGIGCSLTALSQGDEFWVQAAAGGSGSYQLTLTHNDYGSCPDTDGDTVFKFEFEWEKTNSSGSTCGDGVKDEDLGMVWAKKNTLPVKNQNGAQIKWFYDLKVVTQPSGQYSGKVGAKADVDAYTDGHVMIWACEKPPDPVTVTITASCGPVSVSASTVSGTDPYPNCVAGYDCGIKIGTEPEDECNEDPLDVWDVPPQTGVHNSKSWSTVPDLHANSTDKLKTWQVNVAESEYFWVRIGVASNIEELCFMYHLPATACPGSWVHQNQQKIDSVEVVEHDGTFEIVP
ncbi:MAG: hypothetical protein ACYSTG_04095 [Planctomycetota bacterium]|jgi:hypothetical protein